MEVAFGRIGSVLVKILEIIKLLPNKKKESRVIIINASQQYLIV